MNCIKCSARLVKNIENTNLAGDKIINTKCTNNHELLIAISRNGIKWTEINESIEGEPVANA